MRDGSNTLIGIVNFTEDVYHEIVTITTENALSAGTVYLVSMKFLAPINPPSVGTGLYYSSYLENGNRK